MKTILQGVQSTCIVESSDQIRVVGVLKLAVVGRDTSSGGRAISSGVGGGP